MSGMVSRSLIMGLSGQYSTHRLIQEIWRSMRDAQALSIALEAMMDGLCGCMWQADGDDDWQRRRRLAYKLLPHAQAVFQHRAANNESSFVRILATRIATTYDFLKLSVSAALWAERAIEDPTLGPALNPAH